MPAVIFSGPKVKTLKAGINLKGNATIWSGNVDPSVSGFEADTGDIYLSTLTGRQYSKVNTGNTDWEEAGKVLGLTAASVPFADANGNLTEDVQLTYNSGTQTLTVQNLTVNGTTTTINTATLDVEDANITINKNGTDATSEGAGLTIKRTGTDGSIIYEDALASKFKAGAAGAEVELVDVSTAQVISNKSIDADNNTISNIGDSELTTGIDAAKLSSGVVSNTEYDYLNGVTSSIQTQLSGKANTDLGNITGITADLIPASDQGINIGNSTTELNNLYVNRARVSQIFADGTGPLRFAVTSGILYDFSVVQAIKLNDRLLTNAAGTDVLDWSGTDLDINTRKIINVVDPTADQDVATKKYVDDTIAASGNSNDIDETEQVLVDNQAAAANITGLALPATLRTFEILMSIERGTSFESKKFIGIQKNADWEINEETIGDDAGVTITITSGGQVQYTSTSTGTAPTIRYRLYGVGVV